jgi:hypothetical protein
MKDKTIFAILIGVVGLAGACGSSSGGGAGGLGGSSSGGSGGSSSGGSGGSSSGGSGGTSAGGSGGTSTGGSGGTSAGGSGGTGAGGSGGASAGGSGGTSSGGTGGTSTGGTGGSSAGGTTISGTVIGKAFNSATTAYWIGMGDAGPNGLQATVLYVFEKAVPCASISHTGWDGPGMFTNNQVLEFRALGPTPHSFKVVGPPPVGATATATGEVAVNHVDNARGAAAEQIFNAGTLTIDAVVPMTSMKGTFDVKFPMGMLKGTFDATYCATGVEP